jgi:hypothetical protein
MNAILQVFECKFGRAEPDASKDASYAPDLARCWLQAEPARQLVQLRSIPILILTSEASYRAAYDDGTSKYLTQAGVKHTFMRLSESGIRGNGHVMMLEENNLEIAALPHRWSERHIG